MHHNEHHRGMTLIETTIYLGLFSVIMTGGIATTWHVLDTMQHNYAALMTQEEGMFIVHKIEWALRGASAVAVRDDVLTITRDDLEPHSQSPITIATHDGDLLLARGNSDPVSLTANTFPVTDVSFTVTPIPNTTVTFISVQFTIRNQPFTVSTYISSS